MTTFFHHRPFHGCKRKGRPTASGFVFFSGYTYSHTGVSSGVGWIMIESNEEIRYAVRHPTHMMCVHSETAVMLRDEVKRCLEGEACDYDRLVGLLEAYVEAAGHARSDADELLNIVRVMRLASAKGKCACGP